MEKLDILIVDDEPAISKALTKILEKLDYNIIAAVPSGLEAINTIKAKVPNLITMDIRLEGDLDGIQTAEKINAKYDIPIIYISSVDTNEIIDRAKKTRPYGYIMKPFEEKDIKASIEMAVYKHSMEKRLRESEERYRSVVTSLNEGIILINSDNQIETCNPAAEKILGIPAHKMLGQTPFNETIPARTESGEVLNKYNFPSYITLTTGKSLSEIIIGVELVEKEIKWLSINTEPIYNNVSTSPSSVVVSFKDITIQKNTEEAYKAIVENSIQGLLVIQEGKIVFSNQAVSEILGYSKDEVYQFHQLDMKDIIHREDYLEIEKYMSAGTNQEKNRRISLRIIKKDGTNGWLDIFVSYFNFRGKLALQLVFIDISEQKAAEENLKESEIKFRMLFENSNDGISLTDETGTMIEWNKAMENITGYSAKEIIGLKIWDLQSKFYGSDQIKDKPEIFKKTLKTFFVTGEAPWLNTLNEIEIITSEQKIKYLQQVGFKITSQKGFRLAAVNRDVTEFKKTEKALAQSEERLRLAMESVNDALWDINPLTLDVYYLSPRWFTILGYSPDELPHTFRTFLDLIHPDDTELINSKMKSIIDGSESKISIEIRMKASNGEYKWLLSRGKSIEIDENGKSCRLIGTHLDIHQRKQMENSLRENEETIKALLNAPNEPIGLFNPNGTIISLNKAAANFIGKNTEELIGRNILDYTPPALSKIRKEMFDRVLFTRQTQVYKEFDDNYIKENSIYPIFDSENNIIKIAVFTKDLTEIYKTQEELKQSEEKYRLLFEETPISHWIIDLSDVKSFLDNMKNIGITDFESFIDALHFENGDSSININLLDVNNFTIELFEANSKKEFVDNFKELFLHDSFTALKRLFIELYKGSYRYEGENVMRTLSGKLIYGYWKFAIAPGYEESWAKILVSGIDMSAKKKIEFALQESEKTLRAILSASPIGIGLAKKRELVWGNDAFYRLFGYKEAELNGKNLSMLYRTNEDSEISKNKLYSQIDEKGIGSTEVWLQTKNKKEIYCLILAKSVDLSAPEKGQIIAIMEITERKKAEDHLRNIAKITSEAEKSKNEAIRIIDKSALLASIGVIAGGITHEINQPLNAIRMGSDGILFWNKQHKILPEMMTEMLEGISEAALRIDEIIKHMRSFWVEPNKSEFHLVNINNSIDKAISLISQKLQSTEIQLKLYTSEEELFVHANPVQLELIVNNLVVHASGALQNFKTEHEKWVKIKTYQDTKNVFLEISDNGPGLPITDSSKLFDPFHSNNEPDDGAGLGLAIVKMFVDRFGAKISARNVPNSGAVFTIVFNKEKNI